MWPTGWSDHGLYLIQTWKPNGSCANVCLSRVSLSFENAGECSFTGFTRTTRGILYARRRSGEPRGKPRERETDKWCNSLLSVPLFLLCTFNPPFLLHCFMEKKEHIKTYLHKSSVSCVENLQQVVFSPVIHIIYSYSPHRLLCTVLSRHAFRKRMGEGGVIPHFFLSLWFDLRPLHGPQVC